MKTDRFDKLMAFLERLEEAKIHFTMSRNRHDAISVEVVVPGERWEIDFLDDGTVDIERFASQGEIQDETVLEELFARFAEQQPVHHDK